MRHNEEPNSLCERLLRISEKKPLLAAIKLTINRLIDAIANTFFSKHPPTHSNLLNIGCGYEDKRPDFINADRLMYDGKLLFEDWTLDASKPWRCHDNHWEGIFTEHMIEHLSYQGALVCLREAMRTLRPGKWIRIVVPDLGRYVEFYNNGTADIAGSEKFAFGAEAISCLTQNWGHSSVWDETLLTAVLGEIGFINITRVDFGQGTDKRLIIDKPERRAESLYVEAQKPS